MLKAADLGGGGREKWDAVWGQYHMLERCGEPIECAGPILFLLSDDASFISATDLRIDGGYLGMGPEGWAGTRCSPAPSRRSASPPAYAKPNVVSSSWMRQAVPA